MTMLPVARRNPAWSASPAPKGSTVRTSSVAGAARGVPCAATTTDCVAAGTSVLSASRQASGERLSAAITMTVAGVEGGSASRDGTASTEP
jgi:hypothetical protein